MRLPVIWCRLPKAGLDQDLGGCGLCVGLRRLVDHLPDHHTHESSPPPGHPSRAQQLHRVPAGLLYHVVVRCVRPVPGE